MVNEIIAAKSLISRISQPQTLIYLHQSTIIRLSRSNILPGEQRPTKHYNNFINPEGLDGEKTLPMNWRLSQDYSGIQPTFLRIVSRKRTLVHGQIRNWTPSLLSIGYQEQVMCWRKDIDQLSRETGVFHIQVEASDPPWPSASHNK